MSISYAVDLPMRPWHAGPTLNWPNINDEARPHCSGETMNPTIPNADLVAADKAHLLHPLTRHSMFLDSGPVLVVAGKGAQVQLADGQWLIDGSAGLWCVNVGHGRAELAQASAQQMREVAFTPTFGSFSNVPAIRLA